MQQAWCGERGGGKKKEKEKTSQIFTGLFQELSIHGLRGWNNQFLRKSVRSWTCRAVGRDREGMEPLGMAEIYKKPKKRERGCRSGGTEPKFWVSVRKQACQ